MARAAVGQVIALEIAPDRRVLDALQRLCWDEDHRLAVARQCRDPRIDATPWDVTFHREILWLFSWIIARRLARAEPAHRRSSALRFDHVLSLMPRHGLAVHVLRRAAPFAIMGIPTDVGLPPEQRDVGADVVAAIASALGIDGHLTARTGSCEQKVRRAGGDARRLTVVTGRDHTARMVRASVDGPVLGATGRCVVLLGNSTTRVRTTAVALQAHERPSSCTRLGAAFVGSVADDHWPTLDAGPSVVDEVGAVLRRHHPSAVLVLRDAKDAKDADSCAVDVLHGYRTVVCDDDGAVASAQGFGADPVHGWPGDFLS